MGVLHNVQNNFISSLGGSGITSTSQNTITLAATPSISPPFYLTVGTDPLNSPLTCEIVEVTANNSGTLTINRAQQNTVAQTFSSSTKVQMLVTASHFNEIYFAINSSPMFPQNMLIDLNGLTIGNFTVTLIPILLGTVTLS